MFLLSFASNFVFVFSESASKRNFQLWAASLATPVESPLVVEAVYHKYSQWLSLGPSHHTAFI